MLKFFPQDACRIALQSKDNLADSKMLGTIKKQMNVIRLNGKMQNLDVNLCHFFLQQGNQPLGHIPNKHLATAARYPNDMIPDRGHRAFVVSISIRYRHILSAGVRRINGASRRAKFIPSLKHLSLPKSFAIRDHCSSP
jgi:hypothetical protein